MPDAVELTFVAPDVVGGTWKQWGDNFTDAGDLVDQAIAKVPAGGSIKRLIIAGHGAEENDPSGAKNILGHPKQVLIDGTFGFDNTTGGTQIVDGSNGEHAPGVPHPPIVDPAVEKELRRLKPYLRPDAVIEFRVCGFGAGSKGAKALQAIADITGATVTGPVDSISAFAPVSGILTQWRTAYPPGVGGATVVSGVRGTPAPPAGGGEAGHDIATVPRYVPIRGVPAPAPPGPAIVLPELGADITPAEKRQMEREHEARVHNAEREAGVPLTPFDDGSRAPGPSGVPIIRGFLGAVSVACLAGAGLALGHLGPFALSAAIPAADAPPVVSSYTAQLAPPSTVFTVNATSPGGHALTYTWKGSIGCGTFRSSGTTAEWTHENAPPPPPDLSKYDGDGDGIPDYCPHTDVPNFSHPGTVTVVVADSTGGSVECSRSGSLSGVGQCQVTARASAMPGTAGAAVATAPSDTLPELPPGHEQADLVATAPGDTLPAGLGLLGAAVLAGVGAALIGRRRPVGVPGAAAIDEGEDDDDDKPHAKCDRERARVAQLEALVDAKRKELSEANLESARDPSLRQDERSSREISLGDQLWELSKALGEAKAALAACLGSGSPGGPSDGGFQPTPPSDAAPPEGGFDPAPPSEPTPGAEDPTDRTEIG